MNIRKRVCLGLKYGLLSFSVAILVTSVVWALCLVVGVDLLTKPDQFIDNGNLPDDLRFSFKTFLVFAAGALIIAPLIEEGLFRWLPIRTTQYFTNSKIILRVVIALATIIFSALHLYPISIISAFVVGLVLAKAFLRGGYVTSVAAHSTHNFLVLFTAIILTIISHWFL